MKLSVAFFALLSITSTAFASNTSMPSSDKIMLNCTAFSDGDGPMQVELVKKDDKDGYRYEGSQIAFRKEFNFVYQGLLLTISTKQNGVTVSTRSRDLDGGVYLQVDQGKTSEAVNCFGFSK